jgi:hypothetical protein
MNVQNYGSGWIKPPGVPKTLHQMREEKREQEEHQEAMRREQLAQDLAEAEAEAAGAEEEDGMDDVQLDGAQDLDDEIPDADDDFALGGDSDDEEVDDDDDEEGNNEAVGPDDDAIEAALREERRNDLMTARMRMTDDAFREALVRGDPDGDDMYGGAEELNEEDRGHMLAEEDFGQDGIVDHEQIDDADLGMDADLDDDIPEADAGGYEHTDSEADLSSEEEEQSSDDGDVGFAPRAAPLGPPQSPTMRARNRRSTGAGSAPRSSMDLSAFLSQDESSFMDSSPAQGRWSRRG